MEINWFIEKDFDNPLVEELTKRNEKVYIYEENEYCLVVGDSIETETKVYKLSLNSLQFRGPTFFRGSIKSWRCAPDWMDTWLDSNEFLLTSYFHKIHNAFNCNGWFWTYGLVKNYYSNSEAFDRIGPLFIRPNSGLKTFPGGVYKSIADLDYYKLNDNDLCFCCNAELIVNEFRFVVYDKSIIASSPYGDHSPPWSGCETLAYKAAQKVAETVEMISPMYVVDVAINGYGQAYVVELNSMACSGLYECDRGIIIDNIVDYYNKNV